MAPLHLLRGARLPTDRQISTSCPTCGRTQTLAHAPIKRAGNETIYTCVNGCQTIAVVGPPEQTPMEGRGYRLGPYVIRNPHDLVLTIEGADSPLIIPASKAALVNRVLK